MNFAMKKIIAIVSIAVIVVAGTSAAFILTKDHDSTRMHTDETALIYGNANNDYTIDQLDKDLISSIISGETTWDKTNNRFADANCDGKIDEQDLELVDKIIKNEPCKVFYQNYFGEAQEISFPLSEKRIAVTYWQQAEEMAILGLWKNVKVANKSVENRGNIYDLSDVKFIGNASGSGLDSAQVETILEEKIDLIIGSAYDSVRKFADPLKSKGIETIYLWHAGQYCLSTILTLGILMDAKENAEKFVKYWEDIKEKINERVPAEKDRPSAVIVMMHSDEDNYIKSYGGIFTSVNQPAGEWFLIKHLANVFTTDVIGNKSQGRNFYQPEWFLEHPFDNLIVMGSGVNAGTQDDYNKWFENMAAKYYANTTEYKNGNIAGVTFSFGGFSGYALMGVLAWMIYPDVFSLEEAKESMQYYYDNFTDLGSASTIPPQFYTGDGFNASYLR